MMSFQSGSRFVALAGALIPLSACVVGPDFSPPIAITADRSTYVDTAEQTRNGLPTVVGTSPAPTTVEWWRTFRDPVLSRLEARVADENLDVRTATLRVAESRAQVASTASALLPTLNGTAADYRQQFSRNGSQGLLTSAFSSGSSGGSGASGGSSEPSGVKTLFGGFNNYSVGFDAAWELDIWGHVARQLEASEAQLDQNADMRRDTLVSSMAELARDYISLRGSQEQLRIERENLKVAEEIVEVSEDRMAKGLVTGLDVKSSIAQAASIRAQVPMNQQQEAQQINAIGLLLAVPPRGLSHELSRVRPVPLNPPRIPVGLPSELARRRPDVRVAEAQLHAATANIGVAIAEFYPSVRLNADPTFQALEPRNLFKGSSFQEMQIGPSITLPIFQGGKLKSNLVLQEKRQQEAAIAYHRAVLSAWNDVVNQLTAYKSEQLRREALRDQVDNAKQALALARARYDQGVLDINTVLTDAQSVISAQQQYAQSTTNVSIDLVGLYKALGGGWEEIYPASSLVVEQAR